MNKKQIEEYIECPKCGKQIPCTWSGKGNHIFYCSKCKALMAKKWGKPDLYDMR